MGKHAIENEHKPIKKIVASLVILIIIAVTIGVVYYNKSLQNPEDSIENALTALKNYNIEDTNKYIEYEQVLYSLDEILVEEKNQKVEKELFNSIEWKIDKVEVDGDSATAVIELTNKNFIKVVTNWMKIIVAEKDKGKKITNQLSLKQLEKVLSETKEKKTEINKIKLRKKDNAWKIEVTDELRDLIYPGIDTVSAVLENDIIK